MKKIYPSRVTAVNSHAVGYDLWGILHRADCLTVHRLKYRRRLYNPMDIGHSLRITPFI